MAKSDNIIVNKSFEFALDIYDLTKILRTKREYEIASQVLRSGTSIGANVKESQRAVSRPDLLIN